MLQIYKKNTKKNLTNKVNVTSKKESLIYDLLLQNKSSTLSLLTRDIIFSVQNKRVPTKVVISRQQ